MGDDLFSIWVISHRDMTYMLPNKRSAIASSRADWKQDNPEKQVPKESLHIHTKDKIFNGKSHTLHTVPRTVKMGPTIVVPRIRFRK